MIVLSTDLPLNYLLPIYNNNIVRYYSDTASAPMYSEVIINNIPFRIYPSPSGYFEFNFKEIAQTIVNNFEFADALFLGTQPINYILENENGIKDIVYEIKIYLANNTTETYTDFRKFVMQTLNQRNYTKHYLDKDICWLHENINSNLDIKTWEGYPYTLSFYVKPTVDVELQDASTTVIETFPGAEKNSYRLLLNNGIDVLANSKFIVSNGTDILQASNIVITPICKNNFYIKWLNDFGGWNYWLFENFEEQKRTVDLGDVNNDFFNFGENASTVKQIGKDAFTKIDVDTDVIDENDFTYLKSVYTSPKIYMYLQPQGTLASNKLADDWLEISLTPGTVIIKDYKKDLKNLKLTFELPKENTMLL